MLPRYPIVAELSKLQVGQGFKAIGRNDNHGVGNVDASGYSVSSAGDINGDGFVDIIIGAPGATSGVVNLGYGAGQSYVLFGKRDGWNSMLMLDTDADGFTLAGEAVGDKSGWSVSGAGDINGDGISDLVVGAPFASPYGKFQAGKSYVVFGKSGIWKTTLALSNLNGTNGFVLLGEVASDESGFSVSGAGDINNDGIGDLILGAPGAILSAGKSYVIFGDKKLSSSGIFDLSTLNGNNGFVVEGEIAGGQSGYSVSGAGDINDDGISDLIIGAPFVYPSGVTRMGKSYVIFGRCGAWNSTFALSNLDGANGFVLNGEAMNDEGGVAISGIGDVNGDGVNDLIFGAPYASPKIGFDNAGAGCSYIITNATNIPPWFVNATQLAIAQGQTQAFLSPQNIHTTDDWALDKNLQIIISNLQHGRFESTGSVVTKFSQGDASIGKITFVHDGSDNAPSFDISVNDGTLTTGPVSATVNFTPNPSNDNTQNVGIIGAVVGSILGVAALLGLSAIYFRSKAKQELDQAIETIGSGVAAQSDFRKKVFYPIAKGIYEKIKITGCLGHLSATTATRFVSAIQTLIEQLQQQPNFDLDLEKMSHEYQQKLFKEIVKQIRLQVIPQAAHCSHFFKAEVTPVQIEDKASAIAAAVSKALTTSTTNEVHNVLNKDVELEENSTPYVRLEQ